MWQCQEYFGGDGFWALIMAQGAPYMYFRVPWDRKNRFVKKGAFSYDFRPMQPNFDHQEPGKEKCRGCFGLFPGSDEGLRSPRCVTKCTLGYK